MDAVDHYQKKTKWGVLLTNILSEPLFALYNLISYILKGELGATPIQIAVLMMLRPTVSILSLYWSANLHERSDRLKSNLLGAGFLGRMLFLFLPFYQEIWFVILAAAVYLLFYRAGIPAWLEILKLNLPNKSREKIFALGSAIGFLECAILGIIFGKIMDNNPGSWQILFFLSALLGMLNLVFLSRIPINQVLEDTIETKNKGTFFEQIIKPWKESFSLVRSNFEFARFQWGFMLSGVGIMLVQPTLPVFFQDRLHLSYTDIFIGLTFFKSLGFAISSPIWGRMLNRYWINELSSWVFFMVGFFPFLLLLAPLGRNWMYLAFFFYGIAQGGSHLIWNMSGPIFSGSKNSAMFSNVNIIMVGLRGMVAPILGGILATYFGSMTVLVLGGGFCFYGSYWMIRSKKSSKVTSL